MPTPGSPTTRVGADGTGEGLVHRRGEGAQLLAAAHEVDRRHRPGRRAAVAGGVEGRSTRSASRLAGGGVGLDAQLLLQHGGAVVVGAHGPGAVPARGLQPDQLPVPDLVEGSEVDATPRGPQGDRPLTGAPGRVGDEAAHLHALGRELVAPGEGPVVVQAREQLAAVGGQRRAALLEDRGGVARRRLAAPAPGLARRPSGRPGSCPGRASVRSVEVTTSESSSSSVRRSWWSSRRRLVSACCSGEVGQNVPAIRARGCGLPACAARSAMSAIVRDDLDRTSPVASSTTVRSPNRETCNMALFPPGPSLAGRTRLATGRSRASPGALASPPGGHL